MKKTTDQVRFRGDGTIVRRDDAGERLMAFKPLVDGAPIPPEAEVLSVDAKCTDGWHDVTVLYRSGPAQVATPAYREGYDRIFGKRAEVGSA